MWRTSTLSASSGSARSCSSWASSPLSVLNANGSVPEPTVSGSYRGATIERHLRPKARIECVVGAEHVSTVVDTVIREGAERAFVFVVPVEQAYPTATVKTGAVAVEAG